LPDNNRDSRFPPSPAGDAKGFARQLANVMDLPFVLVGSVLIGAGLGYLLDKRLGISPVLTLILGLLGFGGGMFEVIRRLTVRRTTGKQPTGKKDGE
jgi:F0F1-type ATP synthase assembly protein I